MPDFDAPKDKIKEVWNGFDGVVVNADDGRSVPDSRLPIEFIKKVTEYIPVDCMAVTDEFKGALIFPLSG